MRPDADGRGRVETTFDPAQIGADHGARLSPTGEWVALYSGGDQDCVLSPAPTTQPDWSLQLVHLADGTVVTITPLFGPNFLALFEAAAAQLTPADLGDTGITDVRPYIWQALVCGLENPVWSPDGRYLAFAAALDGGSSDLYVYDTQTGALARRSDGPEQIAVISWSPDGQWIVSASANTIGVGVIYHYHAAAVDGRASLTDIDTSTGVSGPLAWVPPTTFITFSFSNNFGSHDLHTTEIETGVHLSLCSGGVFSDAVDYELGLILVSCGGNQLDSDPEGVYLFDLRAGTQRRLSNIPADVQFWGVGSARFVANDFDRQRYLIAADGTITPWPWSSEVAFPSPQGHYFALVLADSLEFYNAAGELVRAVNAIGAGELRYLGWRPDEQGVFFRSGAALYALDMSAGDARQVDKGLENTHDNALAPQWVFP